MANNYFVIPFIAGTIYFFAIIFYRFFIWFQGLSQIDKIRLRKNLLTRQSLKTIKEIFMESLLHRKVFRKNAILGYMHMCFAFGWFMLIVVGHFESIFYTGSLSFPFYQAIFFRYFVHEHQDFFFSNGFTFLMDFFLLMILSGLLLAQFKRISSKRLGMKKTTKLKWGDRIALISLWGIFPLRWLAESLTAAIYHNGGFLTQKSGNILATFLPVNGMEPYTWYAYSFFLGFFFVALPNSRYMHIPTEPFFIFLKNSGITLKKKINSYTRVQVHSCSRCGICLDACQMNHAGISDAQSVYLLKKIRNKNLTDDTLFNCLLCGRCEEICPVGIETNKLRITQRIESAIEYNSDYDFLEERDSKNAEVIYFTGCMGHLTPAVKESMVGIFKFAGINYYFLDEEKAACCGRPLMQAGQYNAAQKLIENNRNLIMSSGAKTLVTSCPICFKVFYEDYALPGIRVLHHSQYLLELTEQGRIPFKKTDLKAVYHDPCELGRGSGIYNEPRKLLNKYVYLHRTKHEYQDSLCCGNSLANIKISSRERDKIRDNALENYLISNPDVLVTACPSCKKSFSKGNKTVVVDIAEIIYHSLSKIENNTSPRNKNRKLNTTYQDLILS